MWTCSCLALPCFAAAITPTTFLLPPLLWVLYKQPPKWGADWTINWALVWVTGALGVLGIVGSLYIIIMGWVSEAIATQNSKAWYNRAGHSTAQHGTVVTHATHCMKLLTVWLCSALASLGSAL